MTTQRLSVARLPIGPARDVERVAVQPAAPPRSGLASCANAHARVVLDVHQRHVERFDLRSSTSAGLVPVDARQDPLTPGLVALDARGRRALVLASRAAHGDPALVLVDFEGSTSRIVHALAGPGWLVGGFFGRDDGSIIACEQSLGDEPRFRLVVVEPGPAREVLALRGMQDPCVPCGVADGLVAITLCLQPDPLTLTGPSSLCVVDTAGGSAVALTHAAGTGVTWHGGVLQVQGGAETVRVRLDGIAGS